MKAHVIQLEHYDDGVSIRDKIRWNKAEHIILVWPRRGRVRIRTVDLVLLQRQAMEMGGQLALVTRDLEMAAAAKEMGLAAFSSIREAQRRSWPRKYRLAPGWWKQGEPRAAVSLGNRDAKIGEREIGGWLRWLVFGIGLLAFVTLLVLFIPKAKVTITPKKQTQSMVLEVWADSNLSALNISGGMPAEIRMIAVEGSASAEASGWSMTANQYASGVVNFTNLTENKINVPKGLVVVTTGDDMKRYETIQAVVVPAGVGASSVAGVRAVQPGVDGNVKAGAITGIEGSYGLSLTVTNDEDITGGTDTLRPTPTEADFKALQKNLLDDLREMALTEERELIGEGEILLEDSIRLVEITREERMPAAGTAADTLTLQLTVNYVVFSIEKADLENIARTALDANIPSGYGNFVDVPEIQFVTPPLMQPDGTARWKISAERELGAVYNENELILEMIGKPAGSVPDLIAERVDLGDAAVVEMTPRWFFLMPLLADAIQLEVQ